MPWGDRRLSVPGPDEYRVLFVQVGGRELAAAEWFDLYRLGPEELTSLVADLSPAELGRARAPGEWTVRQIVHHTADGDDFWTTPIKVALATPGRVCDLGFYRNNDEWPAGLVYAAREIGPSLALIIANRAHVAQLLEHVPDPWERQALVRRPDGHEPEPMTVAAMVAMQARHALEHAAEVRDIVRGS
jgi:hypothetical protein